MRIRNALTIDYGQYVIIQKDTESVVFDSMEEFRFHCPEYADLLDEWDDPDSYMFYCPEDKHFASIIGDEHYVQPAEEFENRPEFDALIDFKDTAEERQLDIYYGLNDAEQLAIARKHVGELAWNLLRMTDWMLLTDSPFTADQRNTIMDVRAEIRSYPGDKTLVELQSITEESLRSMLPEEVASSL